MPFTEYAKFPSIGPWIIKEYRDGEAATYERNPNYWNQPLPYADRAIIKWYGDPASKVAGLLSGDVNMIRVYGRQEIDQIQKSGKDVSVLPFQFRAHGTHYINAERIPDKRVWKALHYLFDYQKANDSIYGKGLWDYSGPINRALPGASPSEKIAQLPGWNPATKEADRKEAAALLRAAGFPDGEGLSIEMLMGSGSGTSFDIGVYHQADVKTIAPKAKFELRPAPDPASYQRALAGREYQMAGGYQIYEALDPRLAAENWKSKASRNYANYSNPQVDQLIDKSFAQPFKEAQGTIAEIEKLLLADLPLIIPNGVFETMGASNKIKGLADRLGPGSGGVYNEVHKARKFVWLEQ
ncbi:MAG: ABC transporter substrate-binding protein [Dehalococcoidia bacterium]